MIEWKSVKSSNPENMKKVFLYKNGYVITGYYEKRRDAFCDAQCDCSHIFNGVTHWAEITLPEKVND